MKKYVFSLIILLIFVLFGVLILKDTNTVLNIIEPDILQIDLNNNNKIDDNETICVADVNAFTTKTKIKIAKLPLEDHLALGYLAQEYANQTLYNKQVKVKFHNEINPNCRIADIYINKNNYGELLINKGFAAANGTYNKDAVAENLNIAEKLNLKLLNLKTNIHHELYCEYGEKTENYIVIPKSQIPKNSSKCKICSVKQNTLKPMKEAETKLSIGDIKLLLTNSITQTKPSNECTSEVCKTLLKKINDTKTSIDIATYGWDNIPAIYDALKSAKSRGVKIRLVYDSVSYSGEDYYKDKQYLIELASEKSSDSNDARLMHNKFIIFDNKSVLTGSMNFSSTGLSGFNTNAVLIINSKEIANLYTKEFEQMLSGNFHDKKVPQDIRNTFIVNGSRVKVLFSPYDKVSKHIIEYINKAEKYIYVPAFVITHNEITNALIQANERGVDVKIILDATSITSRNVKYKQLKDNNVLVKIENFAGKLHSKTMIFDDKYLVVGSMNFSFSGDNRNDENTLIIENAKLAKAYREFFEYFWASISDRWLHAYPGAESRYSIGSCSDGVDNDHDGKIDSEDNSCKIN